MSAADFAKIKALEQRVTELERIVAQLQADKAKTLILKKAS